MAAGVAEGMAAGGRNGETIFAVASGSGRAAVTLLRISGGRAGALLALLCGGCPPARQARLRRVRAGNGEELDRAMVLWFPAPRSYTGEDCAELHLHGGRAVLAGVAEALLAAGARPAEPGEFTRRAFLNGKLDLLQAEAIGDLAEAETAAQRRQALRQMEGELGALYRGWAATLTAVMARQEALIDFPDEDLPVETEAEMLAEVAAVEAGMIAQLGQKAGERLREGLVFAITGPPNAGKSTLLNALARREVAIVSPLPGTTRDVIEVRVDLGGVPVSLLDTAGLRETSDPVEAEGVRRARARAAEADLILELVDATGGCPPGWAAADAEPGPQRLRIATKCDLAAAPAGVELGVSAREGTGMAALHEALAGAAQALTARSGPPPLTRERHRAALREALGCLRSARAAPLPELRAEDLRLAVRALGRITGQVGVEDILDSVFRQFCIGK